MTELILVAVTAVAAGSSCYVLGRMVGREQGAVDAWRRRAEIERRTRR